MDPQEKRIRDKIASMQSQRRVNNARILEISVNIMLKKMVVEALTNVSGPRPIVTEPWSKKIVAYVREHLT